MRSIHLSLKTLRVDMKINFKERVQDITRDIVFS